MRLTQEGPFPVLVCPDEIVVECNIEKSADAKVWLEKARIEGMGTVVNNMGEGHVPVEMGLRAADAWGDV